MLLPVPALLGCPGQSPESRKMVVGFRRLCVIKIIDSNQHLSMLVVCACTCRWFVWSSCWRKCYLMSQTVRLLTLHVMSTRPPGPNKHEVATHHTALLSLAFLSTAVSRVVIDAAFWQVSVTMSQFRDISRNTVQFSSIRYTVNHKIWDVVGPLEDVGF